MPKITVHGGVSDKDFPERGETEPVAQADADRFPDVPVEHEDKVEEIKDEVPQRKSRKTEKE